MRYIFCQKTQAYQIIAETDREERLIREAGARLEQGEQLNYMGCDGRGPCYEQICVVRFNIGGTPYQHVEHRELLGGTCTTTETRYRGGINLHLKSRRTSGLKQLTQLRYAARNSVNYYSCQKINNRPALILAYPVCQDCIETQQTAGLITLLTSQRGKYCSHCLGELNQT